MSECCALGMDAELYIGPVGTPTVIGSLTLYDAVSDVTLNATAGEADITTRANAGWRARCSTLRELSVDLTIKYCPGDLIFGDIRDAYLSNGQLGVGVRTGNTPDDEEIVFDAVVTNMSLNQQLEEGQEWSVTLTLRNFVSWDVVGT